MMQVLLISRSTNLFYHCKHLLFMLIYLNNQKLSLDEFLALDPFSLEEYIVNAQQFLKDWVTDKKYFEMFTSGSTGIPKSITISKQRMKESAELTIKALGLSSEDHSLVCLNINFIAGRMMLVRSYEAGMSCTIVSPSIDPLSVIDPTLPISFVAFVPYQLHSILLRNNSSDMGFINKMKCILVGGAPVNDALEQMIKSLDTPVYSTYGMTETVSHIALRRINGPEASQVYTTLSGVQIDIDERECLKIKGSLTGNEFITTNDIVEIISENQFLWKGRIDNTINSGGIKIIAEEMEGQIEKLFSRLKIERSFFITGLPDDLLGEEVCLIIEGSSLKSQECQILDGLKGIYNKYQVPRKIHYLKDFIKTKTGKIDRIATKAFFL